MRLVIRCLLLLLALCAPLTPASALAAPPTTPPPLRCFEGVEKIQVAPWGLTVESSAGIGLFFATHGNLRVAFGRRFWDRLELEASVQFLGGAHLLAVGEALRAGLILHLSTRTELALAWRVGYMHFHAEMPVGSLWTGSLMVSAIVEMKILLSPHYELRLAPIVGTGFFDRMWGFGLEPTAGFAYRF